MKNSNVYDSYYIGMAAESYISSKCWALGYEALKYPIDFGFDLVVLNSKNSIYAKDSKNNPIYFQIKSGKTSCVGNERELSFSVFYLSKTDIENVIKQNNAFMIFVFRNDPKYPEPQFNKYFWITGSQLQYLYDNNELYYAPDIEKYMLIGFYFEDDKNAFGIIRNYFGYQYTHYAIAEYILSCFDELSFTTLYEEQQYLHALLNKHISS